VRAIINVRFVDRVFIHPWGTSSAYKVRKMTGIPERMRILIGISMPSMVLARWISMSTRSGRITGQEGLRGFLKRKPASKGGTARQKLLLNSAGYVWK
jgi:hypothetical protein